MNDVGPRSEDQGPRQSSPPRKVSEVYLPEPPWTTVPVGPYAAVIDRSDLPLVAGYRWRPIQGRNGKVYATVSHGGKLIYMHRLIMGTAPGLETDHRNHDGLDNCRSNLRAATPSQNRANIRKRSGCLSRFKGVSWDKTRGKWQAKIKVDGVHRNLGRFVDEALAARAYDVAALAAWGEFATLNFPQEVAA